MTHKHKKDGSSIFKDRSLTSIRRKKTIEKILKIVLILIAICMGLAVLIAYSGCTSQAADVDISPATTPIRIHVDDFVIDVSDFSGGATRAAQAPTDYQFAKALTLAFYDADGKEVVKSTQIKTDASTYSTFGEFTFQLPVGKYTLVAIGRDTGDGDAFELSSPTQAAYSSERVRETFSAVQQVTITSAANLSLDITLSRIITKLVVYSTDKQPAGVAKIRTTYGAGSKSFNPTTGLAIDNSGFLVTNSATTEGSLLSIKNFAFLTADEQSIDVTLETLDENGEVLSKKVIPNVPFRRNRQTTLRGQLFTSSGAIHLETDWLPEVEITF